MYNEVKYIKYAPSASVGLLPTSCSPLPLSLFKPQPYTEFSLVSPAFCWCLKVFGVLFSQRLAIEMKCLPGFVPYTGIGLVCAWSGLVGSVLIPRPQCKPIYALSRLADSLVRIHSSLILVSFACARAGGERVVWTANGLAWVCFASMTTTLSQLTRHTRCCSSVLNSQ